MSRLAFSAVIAAVALGGCNTEFAASAGKTEQSMAASCQAWEQRAKEAANPNAELIARHNLLMAKAEQFKREALARYDDVAARQAAIENEVQAKIDADGLYDWRYDLKTARECWDGLNLAEEIHRQQVERLAELAQHLADNQTPPEALPLSGNPPHPACLGAAPECREAPQ